MGRLEHGAFQREAVGGRNLNHLESAHLLFVRGTSRIRVQRPGNGPVHSEELDLRWSLVIPK